MPIDLQRIMDEDRADRARQNKEHGSLFKSNRKRNVLIGAAGALAVAIFAGLAFYNPFTESLPWGSGPEQITVGTPTETYVAPQWFQEPDSTYPLALEAWQKTPYLGHDDDSLASTVRNATGSYVVTIPAQILPSTSTGYTDNAGFAFNEDGSKNMLYSLWTQENFSASAIVAVERIINPTFGGWVKDSRTNDLTAIKEKLADLFTGDYLISDAPLPVLTDSTPIPGFEMGDGLPSNGTGWTGRASDWSIEFVYDETAQNYVATARVAVVYSIWKADRTIVTTGGELVLTLVPNHNAKGQTDRVLISSATWTPESV